MISALILVFCIGYLLIIFEHAIKIDKSVSALLTGISSWIILATNQPFPEDTEQISEYLSRSLGDISAILFFLLGAMTIVELIDLHKGFEVISSRITTRKKINLLIVISLVSFFLSSVLDNLTTTIVMVSICRKLIHSNEERWWYVSYVIIAANAGGAWSPIGDVTTTMLWIAHKVSSTRLIIHLLIPSLLCIVVPLMIASRFQLFQSYIASSNKDSRNHHPSSVFHLTLGIVLLIAVPVFKAITHLPPYLGMMGALAIFWLISELKHPYSFPESEANYKPSVRLALSKIEIPSILFFFGILLAISALEYAGQLEHLGNFMNQVSPNNATVAFMLGLLSAVIDNVPLVAGSIGMYHLPLDDPFWHQLAFAAGTGGSLLIIGSAAGVAVMGIEKIKYNWYVKHISILALMGYLAGWIYLFYI